MPKGYIDMSTLDTEEPRGYLTQKPVSLEVKIADLRMKRAQLWSSLRMINKELQERLKERRARAEAEEE